MSANPSPVTLDGKVILVIGGTSGIGLAVVQGALRQGANVFAVGLPSAPSATGEVWEKLLSADGSRFGALTADAVEEDTATVAVRQSVERWGRLDGLVHVAGGSGRPWGDGPLHGVPLEAWKRTLQWNLDTVFFSNRAAVQQFLKQQGGAIVNITSVLAEYPAPRYFATHAYATAKAAIVGLTRAVAAYYAPCNIRVNAVAPGLVQTPMAERALEDPATLAYIAHKQPLQGGRPGQPDEISSTVLFLLSDAARYITGQVIAVDGGWSVCDSGATLTHQEIVSNVK